MKISKILTLFTILLFYSCSYTSVKNTSNTNGAVNTFESFFSNVISFDSDALSEYVTESSSLGFLDVLKMYEKVSANVITDETKDEIQNTFSHIFSASTYSILNSNIGRKNATMDVVISMPDEKAIEKVINEHTHSIAKELFSEYENEDMTNLYVQDAYIRDIMIVLKEKINPASIPHDAVDGVITLQKIDNNWFIDTVSKKSL